jgi:predicted amidohydrolase
MSDFRIAAAQVASVRGDIAGNIRTHTAAAESAAARGISVLVFPELSLIGYEPDLAAELAITSTDERLAPLVALAQEHQMALVVGAPLQNAGAKPCLGTILFAADGSTHAYAKMHLGDSEPKYFAPGSSPLAFATHGEAIGIAICADSSRPSHPQAYADGGATVYAASVFLNADWYASDAPRLAKYASRFRMLVLMANHAAAVGTYVSAGRSAVWAPDGALLAESAGTESSLVIATRTRKIWHGEVVQV